MPEYIECESSVICIGSLLVYKNKYYLQVYLDNYKIIDYLDDNLFED